MRVGDVGGGLHHYGIAVSRAALNDFGTDLASRAASVIDYELLAQHVTHLLENHAPNHVVGAPRRKHDNNAYWL
jgi:hypothetical protein